MSIKITDDMKELIKDSRYKSLSRETFVIEECSELIKELIKYERYSKGDPSFRGGNNSKQIFEEACDVLATVFMMLYKKGYSDEQIQEQMDAKVKRALNVKSKEDICKNINICHLLNHSLNNNEIERMWTVLKTIDNAIILSNKIITLNADLNSHSDSKICDLATKYQIIICDNNVFATAGFVCTVFYGAVLINIDAVKDDMSLDIIIDTLKKQGIL